jgi:hypothetical protein
MLEYLGARELSAVGVTTIDRARSVRVRSWMRCELSEDGTEVELHYTHPNGRKACDVEKLRKPGVALRVRRTPDRSNHFIMILHSDCSETLICWDAVSYREKPKTLYYHWVDTNKEWKTKALLSHVKNNTLSERLGMYQLGSLGRSQCAQYQRMKAKVKTVEQ